MKTKLAPSLERSAIYRLCLQGRVSIDWSDWMTDSMVAFEDDRTVVTGEVRDQAGLFGLLSFVRDLGVPLVSVEFLPTRKENVMYKNIVSIALKGIALAMGVAVIVEHPRLADRGKRDQPDEFRPDLAGSCGIPERVSGSMTRPSLAVSGGHYKPEALLPRAAALLEPGSNLYIPLATLAQAWRLRPRHGGRPEATAIGADLHGRRRWTASTLAAGRGLRPRRPCAAMCAGRVTQAEAGGAARIPHPGNEERAVDYENLIVTTRGRVGLITLNRPKALPNALNDALMDELGAALRAFDGDDGIGAIVVTGTEKAFAAGADIGAMKDRSYMGVFKSDFITRNWEELKRIRKPVIAAVAGYALGGGCELVMMCDIVIAAEFLHAFFTCR